MLNTLRQRIASLIAPEKNSMSLSNEFLRYGNKRMTPNWDSVTMNDRDFYTGYSYAAIGVRANSTARIAIENIKTKSNKSNEEIIHPYLTKINDSPSFSNYDFWHDISVFLDLEGVFYLMAVRNYDGSKYGDIQYFKMLNPYNITRVLTQDGLDVAGYIEVKKSMQREIPKSMIIEIRELNPFDSDNPYSMTDAAKESQFTIKTSGDYTRHTLRNNINAPGIISSDVILDDKTFQNFRDRVVNHTKGEPLFGNGTGALKWDNMQSSLKDAALEKVNQTSRDELFATAGVSKTIMGVEESGTTRETARVQKDLHAENQILPRIQRIIDCLNQDYKNNYNSQYKTTGIEMYVINPNATDHESAIKDVEVKQKRSELYNDLISKGYDSKTASKYVTGEIGIDQLGEPSKKPADEASKEGKQQIDKYMKVDNATTALISQQQGFLQNAIVNIEERLVVSAINRVTRKTAKNDFSDEFSDEGDVISKSEKKESYNELLLIITAFYGVIMNLRGGETMRDRSGEYNLPGTFSFNSEIQKYIKEISKKTSESHIDTIASDLFESVKRDALAGLGQQEMISNIKNKYAREMVDGRAKAIARTEANRAFTRAQYEADIQFIKQNNLQGRAYKKLRTRSGNPCKFCSALADEPPVPFMDSFRKIGDKITIDGQEFVIGFENIMAGNIHTNCSCEYELIIISDTNKRKEVDEYINALIEVV